MVETTSVVAELRDRAGKGAARATRRAGRVPAVIYGNKQDPVMISLEPIQLTKELGSGYFYTRIYEIEAGDKKERVLPRDVQFHPVTDVPMHVDFMRFGPKTKFDVEVSVEFINEEECPGLKQGGVLNIVRHSVDLRCSPDAIPESITADLTGYEIGDSLHISEITLPEGVTPTITDRDFTVATIAAPTVVVDEDPTEEDGLMPDEDGNIPEVEGEDGESEDDSEGGEDKE
ncbi:MAG: 50S ribosomal protein L25/general stress protein Ctc [Rhodospirillales bacterium]|jgi:large subunit ribosomal protein L25|nr:50S ribosomal protein L25/general stress protein Ctc [Rhodospirillales bacterium]MBT4039908.1 50S ribosomal protein L25/general stress protein Ctc [Rhodospirillales bacterium]MBT4625687.1 50S ribosomal protein L25/general stress protein Ctc [Rhodospirillales bacterium]MBT5352353.1 50S ribosomal protein L25/general stress protein Ctc [Rhodospirillales bacterium]MBT5519799.1 50S ribosomal protein L25/general stress protein Ctc [Rhodospirillales bacterium]